MKQVLPLAVLLAATAVATAGNPSPETDGTQKAHRNLASLATPQTFTCELKDVFLTREIGVSSEDRTVLRTGESSSLRDTQTETATATAESTASRTRGNSREDDVRSSTRLNADAGLKWGFIPSASVGGGYSRDGTTTKRNGEESAETDRVGHSTSITESTEQTVSQDTGKEQEVIDASRRGNYFLEFFVAFRNRDATDTLLIDGTRMRAVIGGPGLTGSIAVPDEERGEIRLGAEETVCTFRCPIRDERRLAELLRLSDGGLLPRLRLTVSGADIPVRSERTGKNVLSDQQTQAQHRPGPLVSVEFGELRNLSPWRISRHHTAESGTRGRPVLLREALQAIEEVSIDQSDSLPEELFSFSAAGDLDRVVGRPLLNRNEDGRYQMVAVRATKADGTSSLHLPLAGTMNRPLKEDESEIALFSFDFDEFAKMAVLNPVYFAGLRSELEEYLAATDKTALSVWKRLFEERQFMEAFEEVRGNREMYRNAAEQGDLNAVVLLVMVAQLESNFETSMEFYRMAADQENPSAQLELGLFYQLMGADVKAVEWFRKAAEQEYADAQCILGDCYANGEGVAKDMKEAVEWYRKAAEQEDADAQWTLGNCYADGEGVPKDMKEAVKRYRKAAEQGHADAMTRLGHCYRTGQGVPKDVEKANEWDEKAAEQDLELRGVDSEE